LQVVVKCQQRLLGLITKSSRISSNGPGRTGKEASHGKQRPDALTNLARYRSSLLLEGWDVLNSGIVAVIAVVGGFGGFGGVGGIGNRRNF
jgi:hypothetical protein